MSMKYCTNCGSPLAEGAKFCANCGAKVLSAPAQPQSPSAQQPAPAQAQPKPKEPARAARKPAAPVIAPIVKDMFASATSGTMRMSSWTAANPVKKAVEAAKTVSSAAKTVQGKATQSKLEEKSGGKRRGGCLRFILIVLLIIGICRLIREIVRKQKAVNKAE